jgi:hypothetical protein
MRITYRCSAAPDNIFPRSRKTGVDCRRIFCSFFFQEIVMTSLRISGSISRAAIATAVIITAVIITEVSWANAALASQGPGGGMGTASHLTQLAMAILVYGASALVVGAGLIGAVRGR